jgi:hypothetical protein
MHERAAELSDVRGTSSAHLDTAPSLIRRLRSSHAAGARWSRTMVRGDELARCASRG